MDADVRDRDDAPPPAALSLEPGRMLNGIYRIDGFVARGGMGDVYAGVNVETEEKVAIKAMLPRLAADPKILSLFRSEARLLTRVSHPAVAQYRVFARDPDLGLHYLVTDFIDGEALTARLAGPPPDADAVERLLRRLAGGLRVPHAIGAIHRDMAPDNILLPGGRIDDATIIDFGIAKYVEPDDRTVVVEGFAGKLGYVAPEQFGLFGTRIGPWTDIYSTALTTLAFARADRIDMGRTIAEAVEKRSAVPDLAALPERLRPVLAAMLVPDPAARTASMEAVLAALDTAPVSVAAPRPAARAPVAPRESGNRPGWIVPAAIVAAVIVAVALAWLLIPSNVPRPAPALIRSAPPPPRPAPVVPPPVVTTPAAPPDAPAQTPPAATPVGLIAGVSRRGLQPNTHNCGPEPGVWSGAMASGLTPGHDATLLFVAPSGAVRPLFAGSPPRGVAGMRVHPAGAGRYRVALCLHAPGAAAYVLVAGTRGVPALTGASAADTAARYRAFAAAQGGTARVAWLSVAPQGAPVAAAPAAVSSPPSPVARATLLPPFGFCRRFASGGWHDLGVRTRDACIAEAFGSDRVVHAEFGGVLIRRYAGAFEVQHGGVWQRIDAAATAVR